MRQHEGLVLNLAFACAPGSLTLRAAANPWPHAPFLTCTPLLARSVDLASTFYALNPSGDLAATQATFQDWFSGMRGWQVGGAGAVG